MPLPLSSIALAGLIFIGFSHRPDAPAQPAPTFTQSPVTVDQAISASPQSPPLAGTESTHSSAARPPMTPGSREDGHSFSEPNQLARCIAANIRRKLPQLHVRPVSGGVPNEIGYLVLSDARMQPSNIGVIRIIRSETGTTLTTWLRNGDNGMNGTPGKFADRLIAGC